MGFFERHGKLPIVKTVALPPRHEEDRSPRPLFELEPDRALIVLEALRNGASPFTAMRAAGWGAQSYYRWQEHARAGKEPFAAYFEQVYQAMAEARARAEQTLTMKNPEAYLTRGPGRLSEIAGDGQWAESKGSNVTVQTAVLSQPTEGAHDLDRLSVDELKALEAILAKASRGGPDGESGAPLVALV
jgi:hypothetical protein